MLVQFVAVSDDGDAGVGVVFQNPLRQQHHHDALAATLRVPDDAAAAVAHMLLRRLDAEVLMHTRQFLDAAIEKHEVVHQFDQPVLAAHLQQVFVELEASVVLLVFLPPQEILFRCADGAVLQPFGVVACEDELDRREEPLIELWLLVGKVLANAITDADAAALQFQHADSDAVYVENQIGPPLVVAIQGDFLSDGEVVLFRLLPVDEVDSLRDLPGLGFHRNTVAQEAVDSLVVVVEAAGVVVRFGA